MSAVLTAVAIGIGCIVAAMLKAAAKLVFRVLKQ